MAIAADKSRVSFPRAETTASNGPGDSTIKASHTRRAYMRRSLSKRFIAIRTSMAKGTVATRYMNSAIPSSNIRAPNGPARRESTFTELHARKSIMPIQKGTTGHTNRMFRVTMVPKPLRRKFPSIIGTNAFR